MEAAAAIIAVIFAILVAFAVIATVRAVRAVKRGVDRTVTQARRTVEDTRLKAKQYTQPGAGGEVAQLRLSLRTSMRATQEALRAGLPEDPSLSESLALFERLSAHGRELDEDLRKLEDEPDKGRVAACLPELRERTERVRHSADSLRWAAQDRQRRFAEDDLAVLSEQIEMEAGALRHWATEEPEGAGAAGAGSSGASGGAGAAGAAGAGSSGASGGARAAEAPRASAGDEPEAAERPAISGRNVWQQAGYAWQKARRPESTS
ncbi:putative membrane protein YgcG [Streptomyces olivoverticillatus]|uniref:Putative membrane protein YgcG n=1 Tax=Streptomyces olivoverticillatus TaxID=66427 RepID=A0A7W7PJU8_9ACTN|nr:hypothetical protein [Streptomyces olivoverticillatus]MBB4892489.1 putative membrane protein YgcG [Streptomyces olivoverticillatus]